MPLYECVYWMGVRHPLPLVNQVIHRNAQFVVNKGGVIRRLENMGCTQLAYPMKRHHETHLWGRLVLMLFDGSPTMVNEVRESLRKDHTVFRWVFYKTKDPFRPLYDERKYMMVENLPPALKSLKRTPEQQFDDILSELSPEKAALAFADEYTRKMELGDDFLPEVRPDLGFASEKPDTTESDLVDARRAQIEALLKKKNRTPADIEAVRPRVVRPVGMPDISASFPRLTVRDETLSPYETSELSEEILRTLTDAIPQAKPGH